MLDFVEVVHLVGCDLGPSVLMLGHLNDRLLHLVFVLSVLQTLESTASVLVQLGEVDAFGLLLGPWTSWNNPSGLSGLEAVGQEHAQGELNSFRKNPSRMKRRLIPQAEARPYGEAAKKIKTGREIIYFTI